MINILFCGNESTFDHILSATLSILKQQKSKEPVTFHIFTMDATHIRKIYRPISPEAVAFLAAAVRRYNKENKVICFDVTDHYRRQFKGCPNESAYRTPYALIYLLADLCPLPPKLLYLDIDPHFKPDIFPLYREDVTGYEYAAARACGAKNLIHLNRINAGMLLMNLAEMRRTGILGTARALLRQKKLALADQTALVRVTTKKKTFPQRFSDQKCKQPQIGFTRKAVL